MADSLQPGYKLTVKIEREVDPLHELTGIPPEDEITAIGGEYECSDLREVTRILMAGVMALRKHLRADDDA